jgi:tetratricopeptide (TPR) repeat protein
MAGFWKRTQLKGEHSVKHNFKIPDFLRDLGLIPSENLDPPPEIFFDDEPLERILYGQELQGPTRANLFYPATELARKILRASLEGKMEDILENASRLAGPEHPLSLGVCFELTEIMRAIVPDYPNPILPFDLSSLGPLLRRIWNYSLEPENRELQGSIGTPLYRWYEHHRRYDEARQILLALIAKYRKNGDRVDDAVMTNNLAFQYMHEARWREAMHLFAEAATLFKEINFSFDHANSRANYWTCGVEILGPDEFDMAEKEMRDFTQILSKFNDWHSRKPYFVLAKIEERRGNVSKAIQLVEKAIQVCKDGKTRYPELDAKYLGYLKNRL